MTLTYTANGIGAGRYLWSFVGSTIRLGWNPSSGDRLRLSVVPRVPAYQTGEEELFGDNQNIDRYLSSAARCGIKAILCKQRSSQLKKEQDYEGAAFEKVQADQFTLDRDNELNIADSKLTRDRVGESASLNRVFP